MTSSKCFWITDPHLNFLTQSQIIEFFLKIQSYQPNGIFLTGDISTGNKIISHLKLMANIISCPIYFVLGNHDFYHSDYSAIQNDIVRLTKDNKNLKYLSVQQSISLTKDVAIIGHDGWYDAGWRNPLLPIVFLADWYFISDFRFCENNAARLSLMKYKSEVAARCLEKSLTKALEENHSTVYLLTHFPPWPEKNDKYGGIFEKFWMPYNSCKVVADMISAVMMNHPNQQLIILAGHTHPKQSSSIKIAQNITCQVGKPLEINSVLI